jgi:hypothetical protein
MTLRCEIGLKDGRKLRYRWRYRDSSAIDEIVDDILLRSERGEDEKYKDVELFINDDIILIPSGKLEYIILKRLGRKEKLAW